MVSSSFRAARGGGSSIGSSPALPLQSPGLRARSSNPFGLGASGHRMGRNDKLHRRGRGTGGLATLLAVGLLLGGCGAFTQTYQRGYVMAPGALEQIPIGATQEQVLIALGTPSTIATVNGEAFYYISQKTERAAAFMPHEVIDQRVVAVYFDKDRKVERLGNYGLKDGRV